MAPKFPNDNQRYVLIGAAIVILGMLLFPPFTGPVVGGNLTNAGYHFVLRPAPGSVWHVNVLQLVVQWVGVLILAALLCLITKSWTQGGGSCDGEADTKPSET